MGIAQPHAMGVGFCGDPGPVPEAHFLTDRALLPVVYPFFPLCLCCLGAVFDVAPHGCNHRQKAIEASGNASEISCRFVRARKFDGGA